jgi:poly-gamma-glutamate synthesis protein (capsule biosynthesis protein)
MDHGPDGLLSTLESLKDSGIATVGAGNNLAEARKILIRNINGLRIGILGVAEHEFSIASHNHPGANPLDIIDYIRNLKSNEGNFDYLIVLVHGGNERYPFPSPRLKKVCHFLVEMGANAVIVQHTHCSGCYEEYNNAFIVYGQGNLIFDLPSQDRSFYEGFIVKLLISEDLNSTIDLIPFSQSDPHPGARRLDKQRSVEFLEEIRTRSLTVTDDVFVRDQWIKFCKRNKSAYLNRVYGLNFILTKLIYRNLYARLFLNNRSLSRLQNTISCESHREVLETLLNNHMV